MNKVKIDYHIPNTGGVFAQVAQEFNHGALWDVSRCLKANKIDAGVMIEYD